MGSSSSGSAGASNGSAKAGTKAVIEVVDPEQQKILEAERMAQQLIEVRRALFLAYIYVSLYVRMYVACANHRHGVVTTTYYYCQEEEEREKKRKSSSTGKKSNGKKN